MLHYGPSLTLLQNPPLITLNSSTFLLDYSSLQINCLSPAVFGDILNLSQISDSQRRDFSKSCVEARVGYGMKNIKKLFIQPHKIAISQCVYTWSIMGYNEICSQLRAVSINVARLRTKFEPESAGGGYADPECYSKD